MPSYTEDNLVQKTTAEYLQHELGWESVYAYNNEDFGPDSLLGRLSDREVVLTRPLWAEIVNETCRVAGKSADGAIQVTAYPTGYHLENPLEE